MYETTLARGESVFIDTPQGRITVLIIGRDGGEAIVGIDAPRELAVHRREVHDRIIAEGGVPVSRARGTKP